MSRRALVLFALLVMMLFSAGLALAQDATAEATAAVAPATPVATTTEPAPAAPSGMITGLRHLHSLLRWVVVVLAVLALLKFLAGLLQGSVYDTLASRLIRLFSISLGLQWLVGIIYFIAMGQFNVGYRWEHAVIMTVAVGVVEMLTRRKGAPDNVRYRNGVIAIVVALLLVYIGVARLPQGWML